MVNPGPESFLAPGGGAGDPRRGLSRRDPHGGGLRKLALAWRFQELEPPSGPRRWEPRVGSSIATGGGEGPGPIAPFLRYPAEPYPVITDAKGPLDSGRVPPPPRSFPLASAYTPGGPASCPLRPGEREKVTVECRSPGDIRFSRHGDGDPILDAWQQAFPRLFPARVGEMPAEPGGSTSATLGETPSLSRVRCCSATTSPPPPVSLGTGPLGRRPSRASSPGDGTGSSYSARNIGIWALHRGRRLGPEFLSSSHRIFVPAGRENLAAFLVASAPMG